MKRLLVVSAVFFCSLLPLLAHASSGLARLTLTKGEVLLFDDDGSEWVPAAPNTPVEEGDRIWCAPGARAEIELNSGTILRLGSNTSLDFLRLDNDDQHLYLGTGRLYARSFHSDRDLQVDSDNATISVGRKSRVHIDLKGSVDPDTEVSVVKGTVYVESATGKTRVRSGEALIFSENGAEVAPLNAPDEWEQWNENRDRKMRQRQAESRYLPEELAIYEDELASNGEWVTVEEYGYAWRPTVSIGIGWAPYQQGRWVWRRGGYVWIASEPWGWAPHHYGRWHHSPRWGWCWVPPRRGDVYWSPGYVAWVDTRRDMAWIPLAPNEVYFGTGFYGSLSINITNVDRHTHVRPINSYRNATVRNAVTVINRGDFVSGRGRPRQGRPAGFERYQGVPAPPQLRPSGREARMPEVRRVKPESRPPAAIQQRHPAHLRERFPRLERDRRSIAPERQPQAIQDRQKTHQQPGVPAPKTPPLSLPPASQAQPPNGRTAPQALPARAPDRRPPGKDIGYREPAQPVQQPSPAIDHKGRSPEKPASAETGNDERRRGRERQTLPEAKPGTPAPRSEARPGQPRRVWKIAPKEMPKDAPQESLKETPREEKQGQREQKDPGEHKQQRRDREGR